MKYVLCAAFLFSMNASAADSPPFEIKGLTTGMSPSGFIAKFKEVAKECKNEPVTSEYTMLPGAVAKVIFEPGMACRYSASAEFGMVDQKSTSVRFSERFSKDRNVLTKDVAMSLTEKYGDNYTKSFTHLNELGKSKFDWFLKPAGGVYSFQEFNSSGLDKCDDISILSLHSRGGLIGMGRRSKPVESSKTDACFKQLTAEVSINFQSKQGFADGYSVELSDFALSRDSWGNDKKLINAHVEKEKESIENSSKSNAPKI